MWRVTFLLYGIDLSQRLQENRFPLCSPWTWLTKSFFRLKTSQHSSHLCGKSANLSSHLSQLTSPLSEWICLIWYSKVSRALNNLWQTTHSTLFHCFMVLLNVSFHDALTLENLKYVGHVDDTALEPALFSTGSASLSHEFSSCLSFVFWCFILIISGTLVHFCLFPISLILLLDGSSIWAWMGCTDMMTHYNSQTDISEIFQTYGQPHKYHFRSQ